MSKTWSLGDVGWMDGHGLKLEKIGPTFSSLDDMPAEITKTFITLQGAFFVIVEGTKQ